MGLYRSLFRPWLTVLAVVPFLALSFDLTTPRFAHAANQTRSAPAIRQPIFRDLERAQKLIEQKDIEQAQTVLQQLRAEKSLSPYEAALSWNLTAYGHSLRQRYQEAISAYENVISTTGVPRALTENATLSLAQLYFTVEEYRRAIEASNRLIDLTEKPNADVYLLIGQAYFQLGEYRQALDPIKTAIDENRNAGVKPKEQWLLLLRVIYHELGDYDNMLAAVKELVRLYPKIEYLRTLAGVYSELEDMKKQLTLLEAIYEQGELDTGPNLINLANLYLLHRIPYKAARVMENALQTQRIEQSERNLILLSQAWYQAREVEKSIAPLQQAAEMSKNGELHLRLAQLYIDLQRWEEAASAIQRGLVKRGIKRPDKAQLMLGMALYNQNKLAQAKLSFQEAVADERSEQIARQWMTYLDAEIERRQRLGDLGEPPT